jgi:hypothetical protein
MDATGLASDKGQLRKAMATATAEVASATNAYAKKAKNNHLAAKTRVTMSDILSGRDTMAADTARNVHAAATGALANLGPYGVTAAKLTALKAAIDAYAASISKPRDAMATASAATKQLNWIRKSRLPTKCSKLLPPGEGILLARLGYCK